MSEIEIEIENSDDAEVDPIVIYPAGVICSRCGGLDKLRVEVRGASDIVASCDECEAKKEPGDG